MVSYVITFAVGVLFGILAVIAINANGEDGIYESIGEKPFDIELMTGNKQKEEDE